MLAHQSGQRVDAKARGVSGILVLLADAVRTAILGRGEP